MTRLVAIIAYWTGLDALFYWLNRNAKRIITFHNILRDEIWREGVANGVSNKLSDFKRIIEECAKRYRFSTDLMDARTLTITFDDGYRNQYTTAFRYLKSKSIPAYVFVSGDVMKGKTLIVDKLLHWAAESPSSRHGGRWISDIWPRFMHDSESKGEKLFEELNSEYSYKEVMKALPDEYVEDRLGAILPDEMNEMRDAGWKIGWHTWSHYPLSKMSEAEVYSELDCPSEYRAACLSFPYGNPSEVGEYAIRIAQEFGYPCAVSNTNVAQHGRYFLPRMALSSNKYLLYFELSGCKLFLKHHKLLPEVRV